MVRHMVTGYLSSTGDIEGMEMEMDIGTLQKPIICDFGLVV